MIIHKTSHKGVLFRIAVSVIALVILWAVSYGGYIYVSDQIAVSSQKQAENRNETALKAAIVAREARKKEPVYITLPGAKQIRAIVEDYSLDSSLWALASKSHAISIKYTPAGLKIPNVATRTDKSDDERSVRSIIDKPLQDMFTAASNAGYQLMIGSGYRSAALQQVYLDSAIASVGFVAANNSIALPGQSEHQTGLAVDISTVSRNCYLDTCFADTSDGKWLENNSFKYGFILRYPKDKETITGYQYEPWHFRYVGVDLATALYESGLTLDEAWTYLVKADDTLKRNGAI